MVLHFSCQLCKKYILIKTSFVNYGHGIIRHICTFTSHYGNEKCSNSPLRKVLEDSSSFQDIKISSHKWATLPYAGKTKLRKQGDYFRNVKHDPGETSIILFPGQGAQYVGMANDLLKFPMAKELFELSSYILGYDLLKLCTEGPKEILNQTQYCQPAVMVCSLAAIEKLKEQRPNVIANCVATAGFSLGEITALVFAGALQFERDYQHGFRRGRSTQSAASALLEHVYECLDNGRHVAGFFFDLSRAFDSPNFDFIESKLFNLGFRGIFLKWVMNFLNNTSMSVKIGNVISDCHWINSGVTQGSFLGPLIFLLFVNDLPQCINPDMLTIFADDTSLLVSGHSYEQLVSSSETILLCYLDWCNSNGLILNIDKTNCIYFQITV